MGCTRAGAFAVTCAMIAGALSLLGFLLPYWSVINVVDSTGGESSTEEVGSDLELAFGVWGTCVMIQNRTVGDSLRGFLLQSAVSHITNESYDHVEAAEATFTCASFFESGVTGIHCEASHGFADGRCSRSERDTPSSLCAADLPVDMLLRAWDEDQSRGTIHISAATRKEVAIWLNTLIPDMCGAPGHATAALTAISLLCSSFSIILLLSGVVLDSLESRIVNSGAVSALFAGCLQAALIGVWMLETYVLHHDRNHFGTSVYFSVVSIIGHFLAYFVALRHLRIERDALVELGLLEEDDESIDDIFKTRKLDEELDVGEKARNLTPRKENTPRTAERVV